MGNIELAHLALRQSKEARTHQWIDRLSPMMLIERRLSEGVTAFQKRPERVVARDCE